MFRRWFRRETIPSRDAADALYAAQSYAQAAAMYRALALQGDPEGAFGLGRCYELGTGQVKNPTLAVRHYREAAEKGYVPAMARLGELYLSGIGEAGTVTPGGAARLGDRTVATSVFQALFPEGLSVPADPVEAARWNRAAADAGDPGAMARYAHQAAAGLGLPANLAQARRWFRRAAGHEQGLGHLGMGLLAVGYYGRHRPMDPVPWLQSAIRLKESAAHLALGIYLLDHPRPDLPDQAGRSLLAAARAEQPYAMYKVGELYASGGHGLPQEVTTAEIWLRRASAKGMVGAKVRLIRLLADQAGRDDHELAVLAREAAEAGHAEAQFLIGVFCLAGQGTVQDAAEAVRWFEKAAAQGITGAYERLGALYGAGVGVDPDPVQAAHWFERAAALGDLDAVTHLALMRREGIGVPANPAAAFEALLAAAERGHAEATLQVGVAYATGAGVAQDYARAAHAYAAAAALGVPEGAFNLGHLYDQGLGVAADPIKAMDAFEQAAQGGLVPAWWALFERTAGAADGLLSEEQRRCLIGAGRLGDPTALAQLQEDADRREQLARSSPDPSADATSAP